MVATYDNLGLHFIYPESWEVAEEDAQGWPRVVSLQTPESGFWTVHIYSAEQDPVSLVTEVERSMAAEYDSLETERVSQQFGNLTAVGCNMLFYCLDLLVASRARAVRTSQATYLMLFQAESREFEVLLPVFEAITLSLLGISEREPD